uniref:Uncharacterized protein n=1 Tax=Triticum urartu TaxID=4572 RepID=A0A8R7UB94_TRIUA
MNRRGEQDATCRYRIRTPWQPADMGCYLHVNEVVRLDGAAEGLVVHPRSARLVLVAAASSTSVTSSSLASFKFEHCAWCWPQRRGPRE